MSRLFKIFLIVVLSVFSTLNLSANDTFFSIEKSAQDTNVIEAWEIIRRNIDNFGTTTTKFALDEAVLNKVADLMQDGSNFRNAFGSNWQSKLDEILQANTELRCIVCNNMNSSNSLLKRLPSMPEMLDNLEYISQFKNSAGFDKVINLMKSNANNRDGINHMIRYMKNNADDFTNVIEFEFKYADDLLNKADLFANGIKYEFKSWTPNIPNPWDSFFSGTGNSYTQFLRYLENSNSISEIKYIFNAGKTDITTVKNAFKDLFTGSKSSEIFNTIWNNQALRQNMFGNRSLSSAQTYFNTLKSNTSSSLYSFIKAE